ncbi:MAG: VIT family protein [Candidatus Saccharimonadales bacterium]
MNKPHHEPHGNKTNSHLNSLRAAVLGADDGIVSVAGIVVGVAGASSSRSVIFTAGIAGLAAGALSMAAGEYVSVSSQKDTEKALLAQERKELRDAPHEELKELQQIYEAKGLSKKTAQLVAYELTSNDAFAAHVDAELGIDPNDLTNPWQAAIASAASFLVGALIPLITILVAPAEFRIIVTFIAVLVALVMTGILSAISSGADKFRATTRVVAGGAIAMAITFTIGKLVGIH